MYDRNGIEFELQVRPSEADVDQIVKGLVAFNSTMAPPEEYTTLAVVARASGDIVGGAFGFTHWNWLHLSHLWVADSWRGHHVGTRLLADVETAALARGATSCHLDTFDFQALDFYLAMGYSSFGSLDNYPEGHVRFFLVKDLTTR